MSLKYAPNLRFVLDETFDRMDDTRRIFADERVRRDVEGDEDGDEDGDEGADLARDAGTGLNDVR